VSLRERVKAHVASLVPYEPGKPIAELERELGITGAVKLASNENALGPSPRALSALQQGLSEIHRYPDGSCFALRAKLAARLGVKTDQLVFGCGSDEILELLVKAFLNSGDEVVHAWPAFAMYPIVAQGMGGRSRAVPLTPDFVHDLPALQAAITPRTRLVFICNPNNPTGTSVGAAAFDDFVSALPEDVLLVVDEAYFEYARRPDFPDALAWLKRRPGTLVLRTFSKIYGLAGLRIGYGVGDFELIGYLERARHPFNVGSLAQIAALAALDDEEHVRASRRSVAAGVTYLERELSELSFRLWPTDANFLLMETGAGSYDFLLREGVIVRSLKGFGLPDHVRLTIGTSEENERVVKALRRWRETRS